jgi:hypothetical protein
VVEIHAHRIVGMMRAGDGDQVQCEIGEDAPVVGFVGVSQYQACNPSAKSRVVEFAPQGLQASFDLTEAFSVSELSEGHRQILVPARQTPVVMIAGIASHTLLELHTGEVSNQLRENGPADIHPPFVPPMRDTGPFSPFGSSFSSNRFSTECRLSSCHVRLIDICKVLYRTLERKTKDPDMSYVRSACHEVAEYLHPGVLTVLESTTYPGTTEEVILPRLSNDGMEVGRDSVLVFLPNALIPEIRPSALTTYPE